MAYGHLVFGKYFADFGGVIDRSKDVGYGAGEVNLGGGAVGDFKLGTAFEPLVVERCRDAVSGPPLGYVVIADQLDAIGGYFAYAFETAYETLLIRNVYQTIVCIVGDIGT